MVQILVIDDDDEFRKMLKLTLRHAGYEVFEASNGKEGIVVYDRENIDLVITDIFMPEKEGVQTIRELRQRSSDLKILAISGGGQFNAVEMLPMAIDLGADGVFEKPFHISQLLEKISRLLKDEHFQNQLS